MKTSKQELRQAFKRLDQELPPRMAAVIRWLRHPASRWVRIPAGIALILGGVLSVLPIFGLWMLPIGLLLLALDAQFLQRPMARFVMWCLHRLDQFRRRADARRK
jgi:hypothetical protein